MVLNSRNVSTFQRPCLLRVRGVGQYNISKLHASLLEYTPNNAVRLREQCSTDFQRFVARGFQTAENKKFGCVFVLRYSSSDAKLRPICKQKLVFLEFKWIGISFKSLNPNISLKDFDFVDQLTGFSSHCIFQ